jgi:hypothetical protein
MGSYEATARELERRILALIPDHPEILDMINVWDLFKVPGFKCDDLGPSLTQATAALASVKKTQYEKNHVGTRTMNPKWLALIADLLQLASREFCRHGCNDLEYPANWTEDDKIEFSRAYESWNSRGRDPTYPEAGMPMDWMAMSFLAAKLKE